MSDEIENKRLEAIQAKRAALAIEQEAKANFVKEMTARKDAAAASATQTSSINKTPDTGIEDHRGSEISGSDDSFARAAENEELGQFTAEIQSAIKDADFENVLGVYLSVVEHQPQLVLFDEDGHPVMVPFVNHTLIVRSRHIYEQIEHNMKSNPVYRSQMTRCTPEQAKMILETVKRTQREIATTGPVSTPLVRAMESIRHGTMALAKQEIMDRVA